MRASPFRHLLQVLLPLHPTWNRTTISRTRIRHALNRPSPLPLQSRPFSVSPRARLFDGGESTIYALSTAPGRAAIAVVRVSGPACVSIYNSICPTTPLPRARVAGVRTLYDPTSTTFDQSAVLDAGALVLYFPGPKTVTGEDVLEFHLHGGPAIVRSVLTAIEHANGNSGYTVRYAEPGEFTRRAFMSDRLGLPQIEALGDTLTADTEQQRRLAVRGASDALSKRYEQWRRQLLYARGELEALIDFSEDQHFDESADELVRSVALQVRDLQVQIALHIQNASKGELMRNGIKVALLGAPNAGKSSLLNRIVGRDAAIVSTEKGTTRDIVDVGINLGGWYCKLGDMAGIRSALVIGAVEKEGIQRARVRALESDVVVVVISLEVDGSDQGVPCQLSVEPDVLRAAYECIRAGKNIIIAVNKCDQLAPQDESALQYFMSTVHQLFPSVPTNRIFGISCIDPDTTVVNSSMESSWPNFLSGLITTFEEMASPLELEGDSNGHYDRSYWEDSLGVTHRQSTNLQKCQGFLDDFLVQTSHATSSTPADSVETDVDIVTAAETLRYAADTLASITGRGESGDVEDVLGVVFEKFCVGK